MGSSLNIVPQLKNLESVFHKKKDKKIDEIHSQSCFKLDMILPLKKQPDEKESRHESEKNLKAR